MAKPQTALTPTAAAAALSFAHLTGVGVPQGAAAATAAGKGANGGASDDSSDDDEDDQNKPAKGAKGASASDDDDDDRKKRDGESDDEYSKRMKALDEQDEKDKAAAATAAAAADGDDDDEEMRGNSAAAQARRRERARCASIFAAPAAARNVALAAHYAFNTRMSRSEAISALEIAPAATQGRAGNPNRQAGNPSVSTSGGGSEPNRKAVVAKSLDAAFAAVTPRKR